MSGSKRGRNNLTIRSPRNNQGNIALKPVAAAASNLFYNIPPVNTPYTTPAVAGPALLSEYMKPAAATRKNWHRNRNLPQPRGPAASPRNLGLRILSTQRGIAAIKNNRTRKQYYNNTLEIRPRDMAKIMIIYFDNLLAIKKTLSKNIPLRVPKGLSEFNLFLDEHPEYVRAIFQHSISMRPSYANNKVNGSRDYLKEVEDAFKSLRPDLAEKLRVIRKDVLDIFNEMLHYIEKGYMIRNL